MKNFNHYTVLKKEAVNGLKIQENGLYVDCTLGGGGHSEYLLSSLRKTGHLYAFDQDDLALKSCQKRLASFIEKQQITLIKSNFCNLKEKLAAYDIRQVDGVLYDLGVSSPQLDEATRGFSYHKCAPLDMRMDVANTQTAFDVVNTYSYADLVKIFYRYGEEKFSKQIARKIEQTRRFKPIETTFDLVDLIKSAIPAFARRGGGHPAKRIFQAIRIEVNAELESLERSLRQAIELLNINGRISVITFHSLEDRIVKNIFKEYSSPKDLPQGLPITPKEKLPILKLINKKPLTATKDELAQNNRARSAKLRIVERVRK